jgi:hypothetical protein
MMRGRAGICGGDPLMAPFDGQERVDMLVVDISLYLLAEYRLYLLARSAILDHDKVHVMFLTRRKIAIASRETRQVQAQGL